MTAGDIKRTEFHTIDALRFFAFLKIYFLHLPVDRDFGLFSALKQGGGIGVVFFFVLSGFLITYILSFEKQLTGGLDLRRFYAKRVLRIWPLFFLFLLIIYLAPHGPDAILAYDPSGYMPDWRASFAFLENYQIILHHQWPGYGPLLVTWSLCIEEHFYIVWAVAVALTPVRRIPMMMALFIIIAIGSRVACVNLLPAYDISTNELITSMDYFACGGLIGYLYATRRDAFERFVLSIPYGVRVFYILFAIIFAFANNDIFIAWGVPGWLHPFIQSVVFALTIAVVIPRESDIKISNTNVLSYLGRISYGLYLWHVLAIAIVAKYFQWHHVQIDTVRILCLTIVLTFSLSVLLASFFYHFFERPIMRLRRYL